MIPATLQSYLLYGNHYCAIEHTTLNKEAMLSGVLLKKTPKTVSVASGFVVSKISACVNHLQKGQHIHLLINNEQILTKKIINNSPNAQKLVYEAFPNIKLNEFLL